MRVLSRQGLASRSPQLDLSSREEMYYPSAAQATPPRDPHVQLDEDSTILIPQEVVERFARSAARRRWRGVYGGDPTGLRQASAEEEDVAPRPQNYTVKRCVTGHATQSRVTGFTNPRPKHIGLTPRAHKAITTNALIHGSA